MIQCNPEYDTSDAPLVMHSPDGETLLVDCTLCHYRHTPDFPWCAPSLGMPPDEPEPGMSGCFLSQHHRRCNCDTKDGRLAAVHMLLPMPESDLYCKLHDLAHTVLEDRQRRVNVITGDPPRTSMRSWIFPLACMTSSHALSVANTWFLQSRVATPYLYTSTPRSHTPGMNPPTNENTIAHRRDLCGALHRS